MGFWNKRIKDTKSLAEDIGVEEIKIKELKQGKREIGGETMEKVLNSLEKNKENKVENQIKKAEILSWYKNTDLAELRKNFGYKTQRELAKKLKRGQGTLCALENKKVNRVCNSLIELYDFYKNDFNKKIEEENKEKEKEVQELPKDEEIVEVVEEYEPFVEEELKKEPVNITSETNVKNLNDEIRRLKRQIMLYEKLIEKL